MKCLEAQNLIRPFLEKKLTDEELSGFLDHVQDCPGCREELELYTAVYSSMGEDSPVKILEGKQWEHLPYHERTERELISAGHYLSVKHTWDAAGRICVILAELVLIVSLLTSPQIDSIVTKAGNVLHSFFSPEWEETETETESELETAGESVY